MQRPKDPAPLVVWSSNLFVWMPVFTWITFFSPERSQVHIVAGILAVWGFRRLNPLDILRTGIGLSFLPSEPALWGYQGLVLSTLVFLNVKRPLAAHRDFRWLGTWFCWCFISYLISQFREPNLLSFWLFAVTFGGSIVVVFLPSSFGLDRDALRATFGFFLGCLLIQAAFLVWQAAVIFAQTSRLIPGDWGIGSTYVSLPFLLALGIFYLISGRVLGTFYRRRLVQSGRGREFVYLLVLLAALILTGSKTIMYSSVLVCAIGILLPILIVTVWRDLRLWSVVVLGVLLLFCASVGSWSVIAHHYGPNYLMTWVHEEPGPGGEPTNHKYKFLVRAVSDIPATFGTWIIGTGPGTAGTRASNLRAYDTMYKTPQQLEMAEDTFNAFTSTPARRYFSDLYQEGFAKSSTHRSATLSQPFSSLISLLVETGFCGLLLFSFFVWRLLRTLARMCGSDRDPFVRRVSLALLLGTLAVGILSFFDTFLERPTMMLPFWILLSLVIVGGQRPSAAAREAGG